MNTPDEAEFTAVGPLSEASGLCGGPGQISCSEANELIQLYLDQICDQDASHRVAEHVDGCPPCEVEVVVYRRIIASLGRCRPDIPADTAERLRRFCADLRSPNAGTT
jgi:hypothetical protein